MIGLFVEFPGADEGSEGWGRSGAAAGAVGPVGPADHAGNLNGADGGDGGAVVGVDDPDHPGIVSNGGTLCLNVEPINGAAEGGIAPGVNRLVFGEAREKLGLERSEEHTSELQSLRHLVCRLLLEKKKTKKKIAQSSKKNTIQKYNSNISHQRSL